MRRTAALLLAGFTVSAIHAQTPTSRPRGQEGQTQTQRNHLGAHSQMHHMGVDREAAIGHALGMAIEGSSLWHSAQKAESKETKRGSQGNQENQAMGKPEAVLEEYARESFQSSDRLFQAVMQDEQGKGESQAHKNEGTEKAGGNDRHGNGHMARHEACEEYYRAARDYSRALQTSCSNTRQAGAQASSSTSSSEACAENTAKVALINHAVKEAIQGVALHQMLRHHGERDRTTQALESHAQQMLASSRQAIDAIDKGGAGGGQSNSRNIQPNGDRAANNQGQAGRVNQAQNDGQGTLRREAARPTYNDERAHSNLKSGEAITVHHLAQLGREVIRTVERLNQELDQMKK